jgi:hypothetical protein
MGNPAEILKAFALFLKQESGLPCEVQRAVLDQLMESLDPPESDEEELLPDPGREWQKAIHRDLLSQDRFYAIHGNDLLLDLLKEAFIVSSVLYSALQNPGAILGGLTVLVYKYHRKKIPIDSGQAVVLQTLKRAPAEGWTPGRIWHELPIRNHFDKAKVLEILNSLKVVRSTTGETTTLVAEGDGSWWTVDV